MSCKHCICMPRTSGKLSWMAGEPFSEEELRSIATIEEREPDRYVLVCEQQGTFDDDGPAQTEIPVERCPKCGDVPTTLPAPPEFRPGELFAYVRDGEGNHLELGQVKRMVADGKYACWYSTGDTAAVTDARNMRKFANAGYSHVERAGEDGWCEWEIVEDGPLYRKRRCSKCLYEHVEDPTGLFTILDPLFCPACGRHVKEG